MDRRSGEWAGALRREASLYQSGRLDRTADPSRVRSQLVAYRQAKRHRAVWSSVAESMDIQLPMRRRPTLPGEVLLHEFMEPHELTIATLAEELGVRSTRSPRSSPAGALSTGTWPTAFHDGSRPAQSCGSTCSARSTSGTCRSSLWCDDTVGEAGPRHLTASSRGDLLVAKYSWNLPYAPRGEVLSGP